MNVMILSPYPKNICKTVYEAGDKYFLFNNSLNLDILREKEINFIVSYGYDKIIKKEITEKFKNRIINLHVSFLPFNKGAHPNLWSHIENTKTGVTIHKIDEGIDTGEIICRKEIFIDKKKHSFRSSYEILRKEIEKLFKENWVNIKSNNYKIILDASKGSFHKKSEGLYLLSKFKFDWDSNIDEAISIIEN